MEKWQSDLISTIVKSRAFRSKDVARDQRVLNHLAMHSAAEYRKERTEEFLANNFDLGTKGSTFIARLARKLDRYYAAAEGRRQTQRIDIVRGHGIDSAERYAVRFVMNGNGLAHLFWRPHLAGQYPTFIAYGVPLFTRSQENTIFTRSTNVNVPEDVKGKDLPGEICWPFVAHGDLLAAVECQRWLAARNVPVNFASFKAGDGLAALTARTSNDANVIALGSTRVNGILSFYQETMLRDAPRLYLPFRLCRYNVIRVDDQERQVGPGFEEVRGARMSSVPVIVTRRLGAIENSATVIASNHGRAVVRAAQILTNENDIVKLFANSLLERWRSEMPANFQILLRVEVYVDEEVAGTFTVEEVWP